MHSCAVQALSGEYREPVLALMSVLRRLGEDTADDHLKFVARLQNVVVWIVQVNDGTVEHSQVAALLDVTSLPMSEVEIATK